jgi:hypothetical protein
MSDYCFCKICGNLVLKNSFHHCEGPIIQEKTYINLLTRVKDAVEGRTQVGHPERTYIGRGEYLKIYDGYVPLDSPLRHKTEAVLDTFCKRGDITKWFLQNCPGFPGFPDLFGFDSEDGPIVTAVQACGVDKHAFFLAQIEEWLPFYVFAIGITPMGDFIEFHKVVDGSWKRYREFI